MWQLLWGRRRRGEGVESGPCLMVKYLDLNVNNNSADGKDTARISREEEEEEEEEEVSLHD